MRVNASIQRWAAIVGLAVLLLPIFLSVQHMIHQQAVKVKMQTALQGNDLVIVELMPEELKWLKPGKEIWLNNSFFDVLNIDSSSIPWKVKGLYDPEDTKLHMKLIRLLHKETQQDDHSLESIAGWWMVWCALPIHWPDLNMPVAEPGKHFTTGTFNLASQTRRPPCPPPWYI